MNRTHYFKRHQENGIWHYYKLLDDSQTPAYEVLNFLGEVPIIDFRTLDMEDFGHKTQYYALWEVGTQVSAEEYRQEWKRATAGDFHVYLQGRQVETEE